MNHLPNGTLAVGAPGSEMRLQAELEDAAKGSDCKIFWDAYFNLAKLHEEWGMSPRQARGAADLVLQVHGWNEP